MKIPSRRSFDTIFGKISNLTLNQQSLVNAEVEGNENIIVSVDLNQVVYKKTKKTFSVKFINYIDPYEISGVRYTMFYTEVDHNLEKGDRVFIVGGNYDSDLIIQDNKFNKKADGYIVQYVDRTKVVLDIEWVDVNPWNEYPIDDFIKVYVASTQEEFDYFLSNLSGSGNIVSGSDRLLSNRFAYDSISLTSNNNILYANGTFSIGQSIKYFIGGAASPDSFMVFDLDTAATSTLQGELLDITSDILSGLQMDLFPFSENDRLMILNDSFTKNGVKFKENHIYMYNQSTSKWEVDRTYMPSFICEQNFRNGRMIRGTYNQGILGNGLEEIEYYGDDVEFNLGTILSVNWNSGSVGLGEGSSDSYFTEYDGVLQPSIKVNSGNNAGFGYNYAYFTNFFNGSFGNGIFRDSSFGSPSASNAVYNHLLGTTLTYSVQTTGGNYIDSRIEFGRISGSLLSNSEVINSEVISSKSVNSEFEKSVFKRSKYLSDKIIKIEAYSDHVIFRLHSESLNSIKRFRMLKFYISEENFLKIKALQNFYFSGLEISGGFSSDILNLFDDKFTVGDYLSSIDRIDQKLEKNYVVQISSKEDNRYIPSGSQSVGFSTQMSQNTLYPYPSLDLMIFDGLESFSGIEYAFFDVSDIIISSGSTIDFFVSGSTYSTTYISSNPGFYDLVSDLNMNYSFTIDTILGYDDTLGSIYTDNINLTNLLIDGITCSTVTKLGPKLNVSNGYILDSDFKSGIFEDSDWITGNYINYNKDNAISTTSSYYDISSLGTSSGDPILEVPINSSIRYELFDVDDVVFLNGMYYDTILNGGEHLVKLNDAYIVNQITSTSSGRRVELIDVLGTQSVIWNVPSFTLQEYLTSKNAENSYNYLHPVKFLNSRIESGIFMRSYFEGCIFKNKEFNTLDKDITFSNSRKLLITDTIFDDNDNDIRSGLFRYSHFTSGSDEWSGGILYNSVWNRSSFTYSTGATSSSIISVIGSPFRNGVVKRSRWVSGEFNNGIFLNSRSNQIGTQSVYDELVPVHWRTDFETRYAWIYGIFNGGQFESSNWESGDFKNGEFYNSNFYGGTASGGLFGRRNIPYGLTKVLSGSFSNLNVINAEFRCQDPTGQISSTFSIEWYSGKFQSGLFGVLVNEPEYSTYELNYPFYSTWYGGEFDGGEFTDISKWITGKFNGGKFTSYYGYPSIPVSDYKSMSQSNYAWQGGEFNGGEFGNFSTSSNSTWYTGEFNGGIFSGKYWRDGVFTRGSFIGSGTSSTTLSNIPSYVSDFSDYFYGLWENGYVTESKEKVITDKKFFTKLEREFTKRRKKPNVEFSGVLWRGGTFSHYDGLIRNSVWLDGAFERGTFKNSSFNPYVNYIEDSNFQTLDNWLINYSDVQPTGGALSLTNNPNIPGYNNLIWTGTSSVTIAYQTSGLQIGQDYSFTIIINELENAHVRYGNWISPINGNFNTSDNWILLNSGAGTVSMIIGQPGYVEMFGGPDNINDASEIIYPGIFEPGMSYTVTLHTFNISGSGIISVGSSGYENPYVQDSNIDTPVSGIFFVSGDSQETVTITALYPDLNIRFSEDASSKIHGIIVTQNSEISSIGPFPQEFSLTFSAIGPDFGIEIYGDSSNVTSSGVDWSAAGLASIQFVELVSGDSGFNLQDTCLWKNGNFEDSEFFISEWQNGKWISGTGQGMIWKNGVANYMNAYNSYWEGGVWRNGNWNGAPFNLNNISPSQSFVSPGFASDILTNIALYRQEVGDTDYQSIFINNAFTQSYAADILTDPELNNGIGNASNQSVEEGDIGTYNWASSSSYDGYSLSSGFWYFSSSVADANVSIDRSTSKILYARNNANDIAIFDSIGFQYHIEIQYLIQYGPTTSIPLSNPYVQFVVGYGISSGSSANNGAVNYITETIVNVAPISPSLENFGQSKIKTLNYTFAPTNVGYPTSSARRLYIQLLFASPGTKLIITRINVEANQLSYEHTYNNMTYSIMSMTPSYSDVLQLPSTIEYLGGFNSGGQISIQFGNGVFTSGTFSSVWENGVWNQGLRYDKNLVYFDNLMFFSGTTKPLAFMGSVDNRGSNQYSYDMNVTINSSVDSRISFKPTNWILSLKVSESTIQSEDGTISDQIGIDLRDLFRIGDRVSVGNIIAIDINENRRLIRDSLTVVSVEETNISVQLTINFPIRRIERDSEFHFIYVTKNVWLNGAFLNGTFRGVWNNGLFRGYPYITKMLDSEWIDGRFEGGRFRGITVSSTDIDTTSVNINSGLIQNFQLFKDQDTSILPFTHSYNSWIDVNYITQSFVDISRDNIYSSSYGVISKENFYRQMTVDILQSNSNIRNDYNQDFFNYLLGVKYKEYENYLEDVGSFENFYSTSNTTGIRNFINDSFTWSTWPSLNYAFGDITSNTDDDDDLSNNNEKKLRIANPLASIYLNNSFVNSIFKKRYSYISFDIDYASGPGMFIRRNDFDPYYDLLNRPSTSIKEYFFNKNDLNIYFQSNSVVNVYTISNLKFVETDAIPFFQLGTESSVNQIISSPLQAQSPFIDYSNNNFSLIDSLNISETIFTTIPSTPTVGSGGIISGTAAPGGQSPGIIGGVSPSPLDSGPSTTDSLIGG